MTSDNIIAFWNDFFFTPTPIYTVALFRILFGLILLLDALFIVSNIKEFLGVNGFINYQSYKSRVNNRAFSLFLYLPSTNFSLYLIMALHITSLTLMILGLLTPLAITLTYLTLCSIKNRNPIICNGGDNVSTIMCFYLIFSSSGHVFSLDSIFFNDPNAPTSEYILAAPWAIRLMQIQVSIGATYRSGTALYYIIMNDTYRRFSIPKIALQRPFVQVITWGVLVIELLLGVGLWVNDIRHPLIFVGFALHLSIEYAMNVHLFGWYMMAALLLFIDPMTVVKYIDYVF
jgi:uncharacterized membrane protein YphA (DoxX/SURF4 family)